MPYPQVRNLLKFFHHHVSYLCIALVSDHNSANCKLTNVTSHEAERGSEVLTIQ